MAGHDLHKLVGKIILEEFKDKARLDSDCVEGIQSRQRLSLFSDTELNRKTRLCMVDMLIILNNEVKVIIEVEESGMIPTKICGKFLTTALAVSYRGYKEKLPLANPILFVQVLNTKKIPDRSSIRQQWGNIENGLNSIKEFNNRGLRYALIKGSPSKKDKDYFENEGKDLLIEKINKFLKPGEI